MRILKNLRPAIGSAPSQGSSEQAHILPNANPVNNRERQKNPERLEVLSGEPPVVFDVENPPESELTPLPTAYGPMVIPEGDVIPLRKKRNIENENRRHIRLLKQKLRDETEPPDDIQLDRIIDWLAAKNLDEAFNYAQTFYTTTFLESLDKAFATRLAQSLYTLFASQGRVYTPWADFVSHTPVQA